MMKIIHLAGFCILFVLSANAQKNNIVEYQNSLGGESYDAGSSLIATFDGGYIMAGYTLSTDGNVKHHHSGTPYNSDAWIVKLKSDFKIEWEKTFGGGNDDHAYQIIQTTDGGFIVAASTNSNDGDVTGYKGGIDVWIFKLKADGSLDWEKTYGGYGDEEAKSIVQTTDGGYVIAGYSTSNGADLANNHGLKDVWVFKIKSDGTLLWEKNFGGTDDDEANQVINTLDSGFMVVGYTLSHSIDITHNHGGYDAWSIKLDKDGNILWQNALGGGSHDQAYGVVQNSDSSFVLACQTFSKNGTVKRPLLDSGDVWIVKLNPDGSVDWQKSYGGIGINMTGGIAATPDGGYVVIGTSDAKTRDLTFNHGQNDIWIIKLVNDTIIQWQQSYGGDSSEYGESVSLAKDGGYLIIGETKSDNGDVYANNGATDIWVAKLNSHAAGIEEYSNDNTVAIFPNPINEKLNVQIKDNKTNGRAFVTDISGRVLISQNISTINSQIDVSSLPNGMYFLRYQNREKVWNGKFVKQD